MLSRVLKVLTISAVALGAAATAANAGCEGRKTTGTVVGGVSGGVLGNVITHGSAIGTVGGVVVGGLAGHEIGRSGCRGHYYHHATYRHERGYYDSHHRWHSYASR